MTAESGGCILPSPRRTPLPCPAPPRRQPRPHMCSWEKEVGIYMQSRIDTQSLWLVYPANNHAFIRERPRSNACPAEQSAPCEARLTRYPVLPAEPTPRRGAHLITDLLFRALRSKGRTIMSGATHLTQGIAKKYSKMYVYSEAVYLPPPTPSAMVHEKPRG